MRWIDEGHSVRTVVAAATVLGTLVLWAGPSEAGSCGRKNVTPKVSVTVEKGDVTYSRDRGKADLSREHRRIGQDLEVRGLTVAYPMLRYRISHRSVRAGKGYCVYPSNVEATVGYSRIQVWVASEFRKGSCAYKAVLKHEKEHVAAHYKALRNHKTRIKRRLQKVVRGFRPIRIDKGEDATKAIGKVIDEKMNGVLTTMMNEAEDLNAEIDLPKSYRKVDKKCRKW